MTVTALLRRIQGMDLFYNPSNEDKLQLSTIVMQGEWNYIYFVEIKC